MLKLTDTKSQFDFYVDTYVENFRKSRRVAFTAINMVK